MPHSEKPRRRSWLRPKAPFFMRPAERYPADPRAVFILVLSVFSGIGALITESDPGSLDALVPHWGVVVWGVVLALGSFLTLYGLARDNVNGIITEQIGSVMVGVACIFYSSVALWVVGSGATQPVSIVLAWGLACLVRWWQLQLLLRRIAREKLERDTVKIAQSLANGRDEDWSQ